MEFDMSLKNKKAGILLPIASLPSPHGIGDFGEEAYSFIDLLKEAGVKLWQILPLNPLGYGHSPYQPFSSFAFDPLYIDLDDLKKQGYLDKLPNFFAASNKIRYEEVRAKKEGYLRFAFEKYLKLHPTSLYNFEKTHPWAESYSYFAYFKETEYQQGWDKWPIEKQTFPLHPYKFDKAEEKKRLYHVYLQKVLSEQWDKLHRYANKKGIKIIGDVPFYVGYDSSDVWNNRENFLLDEKYNPTYIAGVPPDYFSATGQRWGNPIYDWKRIEENGFSFLIDRIKGNAKIYDIIRLDHFRAFDTYWKIPASCPTAIEGSWIEAPGYAFFDKLLQECPDISIIAEDLGDLRPEVLTLRDHYKFPGMNVIEFTFFDAEIAKSTKSWHRENLVSYLGTHDNETMKGYLNNLDKENKLKWNKAISSLKLDGKTQSEKMIAYAMNLPSFYSIISMQDLLGLDNKARINKPGIIDEINWTWKMKDFTFFEKKISFLRKLIKGNSR